MKDWTNNLKVGDKVIVTPGFGKGRISVVEKITPKGYIRVDGTLFYPNGSQRTTAWYYSHIEEYTEEKAEQMRQEAIIDRAFDLMRNYNKNRIDYDTAVKILKILSPTKSEDTK